MMSLSKSNIVETWFDDDFFDFAYTVNTVYFWDSLEKGYNELLRILKTGGVFANVFYTEEWLDKTRFTQNYSKYSKKEIVERVKTLGFSKVKLLELQKDKAYCLLARK